MSGRSGKEADGMELVVFGMISVGVGAVLVWIPIGLLIMNTSFLTMHKPFFKILQIFIPGGQEIIFQGIVLLLTVTLVAHMANSIIPAETILLMYVGAQCHWILLLKNLWYV